MKNQMRTTADDALTCLASLQEDADTDVETLCAVRRAALMDHRQQVSSQVLHIAQPIKYNPLTQNRQTKNKHHSKEQRSHNSQTPTTCAADAIGSSPSDWKSSSKSVVNSRAMTTGGGLSEPVSLTSCVRWSSTPS